jgi:lipopolysaccharide transport system ATP-binding protein
VGTGFHPELTGRENIFLNGAILGMTKKEIKSKFDEIVDFAGVERYIDTPVKRYSSGMYVRLAFGVAAHLEPEILIVDEVLAVGDAEFQKKALGKMKDVSGRDGRTVLFVSHNMTAIKNLCSRVIAMKHGKVIEDGESESVVNKYHTSVMDSELEREYEELTAPGNDKIKVKSMRIQPISNHKEEPITVKTPIDIEFEFWNYVDNVPINLSMHVYTPAEECVFNVGTESKILSKGLHKGVCKIPAHLLNDGIFKVTMMIVAESSYALYNFDKGLTLEIQENRSSSAWSGKWPGVVRPQMPFSLD